MTSEKPTNISTIPLRDRFGCTVKEACEATGLKPTKLYELIAAGSIESKKIDKRRIVLVRSLQKLIESNNVVDTDAT
jgi:excisionase family DNA binding protein